MLLNELKKHLRRYDLHNVSEIINLDPLATDRSISSTPIELINNYTGKFSINIGNVKASTAHYRKWGQTYNLTDLEWFQQLLKNSCKENLQNKVNEELMSLDYKFHGEPTYFYIMMKVIVQTTDQDTRALVQCIKISKYPRFRAKMSSPRRVSFAELFRYWKSSTQCPKTLQLF